jgi:hypothetical protein
LSVVYYEKIFLAFSNVEAIQRGCVLFTILLYIIEKEHIYFNVNS